MRASALATALALIATTAQADLPTLLFCLPVETCPYDASCTALENQRPYVLRETDGEWVMQFSPRAPGRWVIMADDLESARTDAPEGAMIALVAAQQSDDGAFMFEEHGLGILAELDHYSRIECFGPAGGS